MLVRPPLSDEGMQAKVLDAGAAGIVVPMINTPDEARALVETTKYPPVGERSWGAYLAQPPRGFQAADYLASANRLFKTFAMIETGLRRWTMSRPLPQPRASTGCSSARNDLCISLTGGEAPDSRHPRVQAVLPRIIKAASDAGKVPGIYAATPELARDFAAMGFRLISVGSDAGFLTAGAAAAHAGLTS